MKYLFYLKGFPKNMDPHDPVLLALSHLVLNHILSADWTHSILTISKISNHINILPVIQIPYTKNHP